MRTNFGLMFALIALATITPSAVAQTPINAPGAMQPSTGTGVVHIMPMYRRQGAHPTNGQDSADEYLALLQVAYGITKNIGIQYDVPMVYRDLRVGAAGGPSDEFGVADSTLLVKWRIFQDDPAPAETTRFSLIGGLQIPGDSDYTWDSSNDAFDPIVGMVFSTVRGRHGFNADALWEFYTGGGRSEGHGDSLRFDASYLFRLAHAQYTPETEGAFYAVAELNGFYDVNGDRELFFSPGLMYEAREFTLDAAVMIPVDQEVDYRAETEIVVAFGLRLSF
jgi:hypothetical protein